MKHLIYLILLISLSYSSVASVHEFKAKTIQGEEILLSQFKGKTLLIVNVASQCGLTKQYKALETLYKKYQQQDFLILAFPANNFGKQEPGSNEEIAKFCNAKFKVTFQMMSKISVKGKDIHPLYQYLTKTGDISKDISWNFEKFLIDKNGKIIQRFKPRTKPNDPSLVDALETALKQ